MKITIVTGLFTKRYVDVDTGHFSVQCSVFSVQCSVMYYFDPNLSGLLIIKFISLPISSLSTINSLKLSLVI